MGRKGGVREGLDCRGRDGTGKERNGIYILHNHNIFILQALIMILVYSTPT
jgi:hypothetical protein